MSPYYFLFYIQYEFMTVESPKYTMICLNSPKSSEFAIFLTDSSQQSLTMFISSCFINYLTDFKK